MGVPDLEEMRESETRRRKATLLGVVLGLRRWHGCAHGDGGVSFWGMETCRWRWGKDDKGFVIMSLRRLWGWGVEGRRRRRQEERDANPGCSFGSWMLVGYITWRLGRERRREAAD